MSLQFGFVSVFFAELFPRFGIGITIILVFIIFLGLFMDPDSKGMTYTFLAIAAIVVIVVLVSTAEAASWWYSSFWWSENISTLLILAFFLAIVGIIIGSGSKDSGSSRMDNSILARMLRKDN